MKKIFLFTVISLVLSSASKSQKAYPDPEFSNEIGWYNKDSLSLVRLEKGSSKMETKTKLGGMAGAETAYVIEGEKSSIRLHSGNGLSFIYSTNGSSKSNPQTDSMMRANGMDPSIYSGMGGQDPSSMITLYKVESEKGKRKVLMMKSGGMMPFGSKKSKSSDKHSFSVRKVREGYWELVIDKSLPRGEYAFTLQGGMSMDGGVTLFAFAID